MYHYNTNLRFATVVAPSKRNPSHHKFPSLEGANTPGLQLRAKNEIALIERLCVQKSTLFIYYVALRRTSVKLSQHQFFCRRFIATPRKDL